ncbi:MAG TPA: hypothetical protein PK114_03800 [Smithellaceae bacterium]|nr:hypothetical protein [Smithellaceae bacterium]
MNNLKTFFMLITVAAFMSCAAVNNTVNTMWGSIVTDEAVKNYFDTYQVSADLDYYISGSDVYPNAILGLNKKYILESSLWKKIELTPAALKELVTNMKAKAEDMGQNQFGFAVRDNRGEKIGLWYSILFAATSVQMKNDREVVIYPPDSDIYEKKEEKRFMKLR